MSLNRDYTVFKSHFLIAAKRLAEQDPNYVLLTPTAKAKTKTSGQFTLKRKKSKSQFDYDDLLCPFEKGMKKP